MATLTSDGRMFVYVLIGADGCECDSLEGIFATMELAEKRKAEIQAGAVLHNKFGTSRSFKTGDCYGNPDLLRIETHEVGGEARDAS